MSTFNGKRIAKSLKIGSHKSTSDMIDDNLTFLIISILVRQSSAWNLMGNI